MDSNEMNERKKKNDQRERERKNSRSERTSVWIWINVSVRFIEPLHDIHVTRVPKMHKHTHIYIHEN